MAEPLKNMYNPQYFETLCPVMKRCITGFDCKQFIFRVFDNTWPDLELKERVRQITMVLHDFMPHNFSEAASILIGLSQALKKESTREQGFAEMFIPDYIQVYGIDHLKESLEAIEVVTQLVSAEFAIRPFIVRYQKETMKQMLSWSKHPSPQVRRLSSEGCRPRLPWAMALPAFKNDPSYILPILENLKSDESLYVRKSVANNLNDIAKDHPDLVLKIAKKWQGKNPDTNWIVKHACRTLLKKGVDHALALHGFDASRRCKVKNLLLTKKKVNIGDDLKFNFQFVNEEKAKEKFRLEYAIDYITSTGKTSRKVFMITENQFEPKKPVMISRKQSFKNLTTRKHFKGKHYLSILSNGRKLAAAPFLLC